MGRYLLYNIEDELMVVYEDCYADANTVISEKIGKCQYSFIKEISKAKAVEYTFLGEE